ncbi:hypothetical protein [Paenibacillus polymyxa]|uniref:hypothetical protein n=1 Tax=Paenibacillus polymyxa TaxID=1406 RepID=UPI000CDB4B4D|nr:hypothetical protein [Paenibacillus polymyxa]POR27076.1 hypothetical protein CG775_14370 [Paenibacillus polymyxa]
MGSLVMDGEEYNFIWETVSNMQLIFHPKYSQDGAVNYKKISELKRSNKVVLLFDRNLLSGLLKLARNGFLKDKKEMQIIGLIMTWIAMNNISASAGLALMEYGTKINDNIEPKRELKEFNNIFEFYPSKIWLRLAQGKLSEIPACSLSVEPFMTKNNYDKEDDHLLMHFATMIRTVYLHRRRELSPVDKIIEFLEWNYKNLLISENTLTYVAMLFTNQTGIRAPKNSGSDDIQKILNGCKNQAWDLNYLSNWSSYHYIEDSMDEIFMFATNDIQLKKIFINTYSNGGVGALIQAVYSKSDSQKIFEVINDNSGVNRIKPNFGENPKKYFRQLIDNEINILKKLLLA